MFSAHFSSELNLFASFLHVFTNFSFIHIFKWKLTLRKMIGCTFINPIRIHGVYPRFALINGPFNICLWQIIS